MCQGYGLRDQEACVRTRLSSTYGSTLRSVNGCVMKTVGSRISTEGCGVGIPLTRNANNLPLKPAIATPARYVPTPQKGICTYPYGPSSKKGTWYNESHMSENMHQILGTFTSSTRLKKNLLYSTTIQYVDRPYLLNKAHWARNLFKTNLL